MIYRCFRTGNFDSIRTLPDTLKSQKLIERIKEKITENIKESSHPPERDHKGRIIKLSGGGLFHEFEWMPDSFLNFLENERKEKAESDEVVKKIHPKPFIATHDPITTKYENPFNSGKKETVYPVFKEADDPYEASQDEFYKAKWIKENKILHGEFKPSSQDKSLTQINRSQLPDIVIFLKEIIRIDWAEINFIIGTNPEEFIEIKFENSPDGELGLKSYMNNLIHNHETISNFNLKKVMKYWGHTDSKYIYFMLMPPWVKGRIYEPLAGPLVKDKHHSRTDTDLSETEEKEKKDVEKGYKLYSS
eukprot:CAMPEP_0196995218 /NCGR_PEP_ID=MMETSP1380-20130617/1383_1 /TAXON_ID=5936 /ORGANISM="Euplotes crassus, Strain CT5" /LENGTH=304 /DNA_ID=CAMNT_0042410833 /DNA_START=168 /DNA_END=1080 /DNA_ORIENTATION=+